MRTDCSNATARLFVAWWPEAEPRAAFARWRDACRWPAGARPVPTAHLHLTLAFLGGVDRALLQSGDLVRALTLPVPETTLAFGTPAMWQSGVAVLQPHAVPEALRDLHDALGHRLRTLGLPTDARAWQPHVTLARHAAGATLAPGALQWQPRTVALVESAADGYRVLHRWSAARVEAEGATGAGDGTARGRPA